MKQIMSGVFFPSTLSIDSLLAREVPQNSSGIELHCKISARPANFYHLSRYLKWNVN